MENHIAVVGISCRSAQAAHYRAFWSSLEDGAVSVGPWPAARRTLSRIWSAAMAGSGAVERRVVKAMTGGYIDDVDAFDPALFGISAREANAIDPQHRLILEACWQALQDAALDPRSLAGTDTGMFAAVSTFDYALLAHELGSGTNAYHGIGASKSLAANRVSHALDLRGPSFAIDSACSSALVGVHQACRALQAGDCGLALVAAANLILSPSASYSFASARMLSPDGRCLPFRSNANGYVRSEAVGALVLQRLEHAVRDGNPVHAVLMGSAVNQDGHTQGVTVPSVEAQVALVRHAWRRAGVGCNDIAAIEAHGTGTPVGDRAELAALSTLFGGRDPGLAPCFIGAVKANMGHAEAASGIISLIKLIGVLQSAEAPLLAGEGAPAALPPALAFPQAGTALRPRTPGATLCGGVSAFGFGGANAHLVVGAPAPAAPAARAALPVALTLSANHPASLQAMREDWIAWLAALPDGQFDAAVHSANRAFASQAHRLLVVAASREQAIDGLRQAGASATQAVRACLCLGDDAGLSAGPLDLLAPAMAERIRSVRQTQGGARADRMAQAALALRLRELAPGALVLGRGAGCWLAHLYRAQGDALAACERIADMAEPQPVQWDCAGMPPAAPVLLIGALPGCAPADPGEQLHAVAADRSQALPVLGRLWAGGVDLRWDALAAPGAPALHGAPCYPFHRQRYWLPRQEAEPASPLPAPAAGPEHALQHDIVLAFGPLAYLAEHRIGGVVVVPGATLLDLALSHAGQTYGGADWQAGEVEFLAPVMLGDEHAATVLRFERAAAGPAIRFEVLSRGPGPAAAGPRVHARGVLTMSATRSAA